MRAKMFVAQTKPSPTRCIHYEARGSAVPVRGGEELDGHDGAAMPRQCEGAMVETGVQARMETCAVCGRTVARQRVKLPVLCSSLCRNKAYRARRRFLRLARELREAREVLEGWGLCTS